MDEQNLPTEESPLEQRTKQFLQELFERMSMTVHVDVHAEGRFLRVNVSGSDAKSLVVGTGAAAKSNVLEAIQLLLGRYLFTGEGGKTVVVDSQGFRDVRCTFLEGAADRLANTSLSTGKHAVVYGMNSFDRRAIHLRLANRDDLRTDSEGDGATRTLLIMGKPKPKQSPPKNTEETEEATS